MKERREFIKKSIALTAGIATIGSLKASDSANKKEYVEKK